MLIDITPQGAVTRPREQGGRQAVALAPTAPTTAHRLVPMFVRDRVVRFAVKQAAPPREVHR